MTIATGAVTFFLLVFSEITPKVIGATYTERAALPASYVLTPLLRLAYPLVWFINLFSGALLWLLRLSRRGAAEGAAQLSLEELRTLVLEGGNFLPPKHQKILLNLFDLESITVDDLMTPHSQIEALDLELSADDLRRELASSNHTRIPVYRGSLDNVVGVLHTRRVLNMGAEDITAQGLANDPTRRRTSCPGAPRCSRRCRTSRRKRNAWAWWWTSTAS